MIAGFSEFEFDLPGALLSRLVEVLDVTAPAPLDASALVEIPDHQGIYQLLIKSAGGFTLVYIGKTDGDAGLRKRLLRHSKKIHHRVNLSPEQVYFRAVRVYVFTAIDLEQQLINHYGGVATVSWNGSGFGSNDPGVERDTTKYKEKHFDMRYPIDTSRRLGFAVPNGTASQILASLKSSLPYLIRYQGLNDRSRAPHPDLDATVVTLDPSEPVTAECIIRQVVLQLPSGWHATRLPSHIIIYKNDTRRFPNGTLIARSG